MTEINPSVVHGALTMIAIAVTVQTLLLLVGAVLLYRAWLQMHMELNQRFATLERKADDVADVVRTAARAMERGSDRVSGIVEETTRAAGAVASSLASPGAMVGVVVARSVLALLKRRSLRRAS